MLTQKEIDLLENYLILKERDKELYYDIKDNIDKYKSFIYDNLAYDIIIKDDLIIIVQDNGCGISQEDLSKVKQKFYKGKNAKSQNGIGLAICDEIVRMHGGDIEIESELNVGTKIIVKIPMKYKENKKSCQNQFMSK